MDRQLFEEMSRPDRQKHKKIGYCDDCGAKLDNPLPEVLEDQKRQMTNTKQLREEKMYKLFEKFDMTTLREISALLYENASPHGEINTHVGKWVFVNPINKQWFSKEEMHTHEQEVKDNFKNKVVAYALDELEHDCLSGPGLSEELSQAIDRLRYWIIETETTNRNTSKPLTKSQTIKLANKVHKALVKEEKWAKEES